MITFKFFENHFFNVCWSVFWLQGALKPLYGPKNRPKKIVFEQFNSDHILRYIIYEFLKKVSSGTGPTCLGPCR